MTRVAAFDDKAQELLLKGHVLRAAENYGRAAEAARALGADNPVTIYSLLQRSQMLSVVAFDATVDPQRRAAHRAESIALLSGAVEALERRRVAGTLLEGKCAAEEEAWYAGMWRRDHPHLTAAGAASRGVLVVADAGSRGLNAHLVLQLAGAWQRLQRSGVLQTRRIEEQMEINAPHEQAFKAAFEESRNAPGLRSCALPGCGAKEVHPAHFKSCAACRTVVYCCREHQVAGWPAHKKACKAARKAAAADDEAGPSGA